MQATIAKLSIRPVVGVTDPSANELPPPPEPLSVPAAEPSLLALVDPVSPPLSEPAPLCSLPLVPVPEATVPSAVEDSNHVGVEEDESPKEAAPAPPLAPSSSSLELLASLTPEAFTLDSSLKGRHKMSKQSFLQPQNGEGLRGARPSDDPLSMLDPLWTLNKT